MEFEEEFEEGLAASRRLFTRHALQNELIVNLTSGKSFKAMSLNVSEGGMMVTCEGENLSVGERLFVELIGRWRFRLGFLIAEVVHERSDQVRGENFRLFGIKFTNLTRLQRETLKGIF